MLNIPKLFYSLCCTRMQSGLIRRIASKGIALLFALSAATACDGVLHSSAPVGLTSPPLGPTFVWQEFFEPESTELSASGIEKVKLVAAYWKRNPGFKVFAYLVVGDANSRELNRHTGTMEPSREIFEKREKAVRDALLREGVPDGSIESTIMDLGPRATWSLLVLVDAAIVSHSDYKPPRRP